MTANLEVGACSNIEELKRYVFSTLCADADLLENEFPTTSRSIKKANGEDCGMLFCVHGPRSVDLTAIWERRSNRVLFYGPTGERYRQTTLPSAIASE